MLYVLTRNDWCRSNLRVKVQVKLVKFLEKPNLVQKKSVWWQVVVLGMACKARWGDKSPSTIYPYFRRPPDRKRPDVSNLQRQATLAVHHPIYPR
jgi:hypothetical protein